MTLHQLLSVKVVEGAVGGNWWDLPGGESPRWGIVMLRGENNHLEISHNNFHCARQEFFSLCTDCNQLECAATLRITAF